MILRLAALLLCCVAVQSVKIVPNQPYTVTLTGSGEWQVSEGSGGVATAWFNASTMEIGWDTITVVTNPTANDQDQAYGAGYLEASLTQPQSWASWVNYRQGGDFNDDPMVIEFAVQQDKWMRTQVLANPTSAYWQHVGLVLAQFDGLVAGYADAAPQDQQLAYVEQLLYALQTETDDIKAAVGLRNADEVSEDSEMLNMHCSVLIKLSPDMNSLLASHVTWSGFDTMLRTYKHYEMNFGLPSNAAPSMSFSSYPLCVMSTDDFYITSQQLVIMETTNEVFNQSLYQFVVAETVPYWVRITVASRMASSGPEWVNTFALYNSGTYNNQWQVVDYKLFTPGQALVPNTLWIAEQIPGWVISDDMTASLTSSGQGYWPSYNVPFFPFVYNISGYTKFKSNAFSYSACPRANIFRRDQHNVVDMPSFQRMMRYNQYQTDPLSNHDACNGISSRCDLNTPFVTKSGGVHVYAPFGGIDCKTTDNLLQASMTAWAVAGPTWDAQPPFAWTLEWPTTSHLGHAQVFDFDFVLMSPYASSNASVSESSSTL